MNILVFHNVVNLARSRPNITDYLFCFERYAGQHNYLYHRIMLPITEALRQFPFDMVIFDSTSLGIVTLRPRPYFYEFKNALAFLMERPTVKLAFPQDDYNHSKILDEWLCDLKCDAVFTPLIEHRDRFYPRTSQQADFFDVLTGYVDDTRLDALAVYAKPFAERTRSIVQRVTLYPPRGGRFARIKGETAEMVKQAALARGLYGIDISTDLRDVLVGEDWFRFLGDAKFCLGAESGVSLWDRDGTILDRTEAYLEAQPGAGFAEVEAACFPGLDRKEPFSAVSPRLFEAAQLRCCQILVEGDYLPGLKPYEHYIPLRADGGNLNEVFALVEDENAAERRAETTYDALIANPEYRYSRLVTRVMEYADGRLAQQARRPAVSAAAFEELRRQHRRQLLPALQERERAAGSKGQALIDRVTMMFAGQFAEPQLRPDGDELLLSELVRDSVAERATVTPQGGEVAGATEADAAGATPTTTPAMAALAAPAPANALTRYFRPAVFAVIALAAGPLGILVLRVLAPGDVGRNATWQMPLFALSALAAGLVVPHHVRPVSVATRNDLLRNTVIWVGFSHSLWFASLLFAGVLASLPRPLAVATAAAQGGLSLGFDLMRRLSSRLSRRVLSRTQRWRYPGWPYWALSVGLCLLVFAAGLPAARHPGPAALSAYAMAALFAATSGLFYESAVICGSLGPRWPRRFAIRVAYAVAAGHLAWLLTLFLTGLLARLPGWLPFATGGVQMTVLFALPLAAAIAFGRLPIGLLVYSPRRDESSTGIEIVEGAQTGARTAWLVAGDRQTDEPRLDGVAAALIGAGWRVVVCASRGQPAHRVDWTLFRLPREHGLRRSFCWLLGAAGRAGRLLAAVGWPPPVQRWAALCWHFCEPQRLHCCRSLLHLAAERPAWLPALVIAADDSACAIAWPLARRADVKFVIDYREQVADRSRDPAQRRCVAAARQVYLRRANLVTAATGNLAEQLTVEHRLDRPPLILHCLGKIANSPPFRPTGERIRVLYQGAIWHPRWLHTAIESMTLWRPEFDLVLRGDADPAYLAEVRRLAARRGLAERVFFESTTASHETVAATKEAADIGYLGYADPSLEGQSEPLQQFFRYVAAGLAVCVAGPSEISRLTHRYGLGSVIDRPAPEAIGEAINRLTRVEIDRCKKASLAAAEELDWRRERGVLLDAIGGLFGSPGAERVAAPGQPRAAPSVAVSAG